MARQSGAARKLKEPESNDTRAAAVAPTTSSPVFEKIRPVLERKPKPPFPAQHLEGSGEESKLSPRPRYRAPEYKAAGKLLGKAAIITGGDSGIGRAVAMIYAREGADVSIVYQTHDEDAEETKLAVEEVNRKCLTFKGDVAEPDFCRRVAEETVRSLGRLDVLVNNAAYQARVAQLEDLSEEQFDLTFKTNMYGYFHMVRACLPHLGAGSAIIATGSETGLFGSATLLDYSATKGAIHAFTRALARNLLKRGIRVNAVAPGPVWTPLNPSDPGASADRVSNFGKDAELGRPAQPEEIAPAYVVFASDADSGFVTGQVLAELGGA